VPLRLVISNTSAKAIYLRFSSAKTHDFSVTDFRKKSVWQWSRGRLFAQAFQARALTANQSMVFKTGWLQKTDKRTSIPLGKYMLTAEFNAIDYAARLGPVTIDIVADKSRGLSKRFAPKATMSLVPIFSN